MEFATALADGDHTVGDEGIIEYRVTLVQDINMAADLNLEGALDDNVKFLTVMRAELDGGVLLLGDIGEFYKEGLCELLFEFGREVIVLVAVLFKYLKTSPRRVMAKEVRVELRPSRRSTTSTSHALAHL